MNAQTLELMLQHELPAAARGNQAAYGRIVSACQNTVTAIALAITRDVQASEDIAQEAFLRAWQQLDRLKNSTSFLPWLRQITRNLARDYLRSQHNRPLSGEAADIAINIAADPSPSPAEHLLRTEEEIAAGEIISALPEDSRETLLLFYREGQSSQQVADLLGLSDAAVRKRLSRARTLVREEMLRHFGEFARSSAPGAAFTLVVVGGLVGSMPAASAATVIGSGVLGGSLGKLGTSGLAAGGLSSSLAGGSAGLFLEHVAQHPASLGGFFGGILGGLIGYAFTWWYLASFCQTAAQRVQVRRFMLLNSGTGALWLTAVMLASVLFRQWQWVFAIFAAGMITLNYQYLFTLPRIMRPLMDHPANRRRRRYYPYLLGGPAIVFSTVVATAAMLYALMRAGAF